MQPLTQQMLAANAYRTLGISGSASQEQIDAAARRMRIFADPRRIPPTAWELPLLGAPARSRAEIEQSVARLHQPESRVVERLLWYCGVSCPASPESLAEQPLLQSTSQCAPAGSDASSIAAQHDSAIAAMHAAWAMDPEGSDTARWRNLMRRVIALCDSPAYADWIASIEAAGDFEKRASDSEIAAAIRKVPAALSAVLATMARKALERNDMNAGAELVLVLRDAGGGAAGGAAVAVLLDGLEDAVSGHCREMDHDLRDKLQTNRSEPDYYFSQNLAASRVAEQFYRVNIKPGLERFCVLADSDANRITRVRSQAAEVLTLLALGWEWGGDYVRAEQTLLTALVLAEDSPASKTAIERSLERCRPLAERQRQPQRQRWQDGVFEMSAQPASGWSTDISSLAHAAAVARQSPNRPANRPDYANRTGKAALVAIVIVVGLMRLLTSSSSTRSYPPGYDSSSPSFNPDQFRREIDHLLSSPIGIRPSSRPSNDAYIDAIERSVLSQTRPVGSVEWPRRLVDSPPQTPMPATNPAPRRPVRPEYFGETTREP